MSVLAVPPVVAQNQALDQDGNVDPAHATDCGESCFSSALAGRSGVRLPPGCVRYALGLPAADGTSSAESLAWLWGRLRGRAVITRLGPDSLWAESGRLRHHGRYAVILGDWVTPGFLHWVLAYERIGPRLSVMGPWDGGYFQYRYSDVQDRSASVQVWLA